MIPAKCLRVLLWVLSVSVLSSPCAVGEETVVYHYDELGRSIATTSNGSSSTVLNLDESSNLLSIHVVEATGLPRISGLTPLSGTVGSIARIFGLNLARSDAETTVTLGGVPADIVHLAPTEMAFEVPPGTTGGQVEVRIGATVASFPAEFTVLRSPTVSSLTPSTSLAGRTNLSLQVEGAHLTGALVDFFPSLTPPAISIDELTIAPDGRSATLSVTISPDADGLYALVAETAEGRSTTAPVGGNSLLVLDPAGDRDGDGLTNGDEVDGGTDPLTPDSQPPVVTWVSPTAGSELVQGESRTLAVDATDDGRVTEVRFSVDGTPLARDGAPPFEATFDVSTGATALTLGAVAEDTNGNVAVAPDLDLPVVPDPLTDVIGRVEDEAGDPLSGVEVRLGDETTATGADGSFSFDRVPTVAGEISAVATGAVDGLAAVATASVPPVRGGTTDLGTLVLRPSRLYYEAQAYPVERTARSVAAADLDGDGARDLVVGADELAVLRNLGDGSFAPPAPLSGTPTLVELRTGDLDGDGLPDVVGVVGYPGTEVLVFLGSEDALLTPPSSFTVGANPLDLVLADFDGDGLLDVATCNEGDDDVSVLLGLGDGTFAPASEYAVGDRPFGIDAADFDGDGDQDLVTANESDGDVSVLLGDGDGTFAPATPSLAGRALDVTAADVDDDGTVDLVVSNQGFSRQLLLLRGRGDGTFQDPEELSAGGDPASTATTDLNGDGRTDIVVLHSSSTSIGFAVLLADPAGGFEPPIRYKTGGRPNRSLVLEDLNQDGHTDLAIPVTNSVAAEVAVHLGSGEGGFQTAGAVTFPGDDGSVYEPQSVTVADFDGDGLLDAAIAANGLWLAEGSGDGALTLRDLSSSFFVSSVTRGDLAGDRRPEIVAVDDSNDRLVVFGSSAPGEELAEIASLPMTSEPVETIAGDFDGDGANDLVAAATSQVVLWRGHGDGTFDGPEALRASGATTVTSGDLNGDGAADLLIGTTDGIVPLFGDGTGAFTAGAPFGNEAYFLPTTLEIADLDGDGKPDVTAGFYDDLSLQGKSSVFLGSGDGTFGPGSAIPSVDAPSSFAVVDVNGDAAADLLFTEDSSEHGGGPGAHVTLLIGRGDGSFTEPVYLLSGRGPVDLAVGDFDGDGDPDVVTANHESGDLSVLLRR